MTAPFLVALALAVVALGGVVWSGVARRRHLHYALVVALFAALGWAIREAEIMGRGLVFDGAAATLHSVHLGAIAVTFLLVPLLVVSGVRLARGEQGGRRLAHRRLAVAFVVAVVVTCALGTAMTLLARKAPSPPATGSGPGTTATPDLG